ncbi:MAG: hypothetical protein K2M41_08020 [Muribaculaceae bacterium]|nr:hypothetical protein [Muribaculaceae bacterium]
MKQVKHIVCLLMIMFIACVAYSTDAQAETTKKVSLFQKNAPSVLDPTLPGDNLDQGQTETCILYKESGRCVFDPDVEAIKKYEIYNGTARVGIYYDQYSFVQDAFNLRGVLILTLTTDSSQLSGKILNY